MVARKDIKGLDDIPDRRKTLQYLGVAILSPIKGQGFFPKDIKDGIRGVTVFNFTSDWIVHKVYPCLSSVIAQGDTKNFIRDRRGGSGAAHRHGGVEG